MTVQLMVNSSPPNYIVKRGEVIANLEGTLKSPSSVVDVVIDIEGGSPVGFNYMFIPDFNRYYFVTDSVSVNNRLFTVSGHVDALTTYASQIMGFRVITSRQASQYNSYINDSRAVAFQNPKHKTIAFPNPMNGDSFVLAIVGNKLTSS